MPVARQPGARSRTELIAGPLEQNAPCNLRFACTSESMGTIRMKKVLLAGAAALATCAAHAAMAKTVSISFDNLCDGMNIIVNKTDRTALETGNGCDEGAHFGAGTIGKIKDRGKAITF